MVKQIKDGFRLNKSSLPKNFPTHLHPSNFWEELGRTIGAFGFLENTLARAIYAFTGTKEKEMAESEVQAALESWYKKLEKSLLDPLSNLIDVYAKSVKEHDLSDIDRFGNFIIELRKITVFRNVLCHGAWLEPSDEQGGSIPLFAHPKKGVWETRIDVKMLICIRKAVSDHAIFIMDSVHQLGFQFPGTVGPLKKI